MNNIKPLGLWITDLHLHLNNVDLFKRTIDGAVKLCKENGVRYIFNGGDTFTSRKGQPQEVLKVLWDSLEQMRKAKITMYTIVGNHDKTDYSSRDSFLIPYQNHKAMQLVEEYDDLDIIEGMRIHMVSFFEDGMYKETLQKCSILDGGFNVCLTHVGIDGAKMNSGISLSSSVTAADFANFNKVYVGHYHNKQQLNEKILYTGSSYPHNFGEDNDKGMWWLADDGLMYQIESNHFAPYVTHEMGHITEDDVNLLLAKDPIGAMHHRVKCNSITPILRARLQSQGYKIVVEKQDIIMSMEKETIEQYDSKGLMEEYNTWAKKRNVQDADHGKKLLEQVL